eukprot:157321-Pyramimonas_sp.AAC.1
MAAFHRHADTRAQPLQMQCDVQARSVHAVATEHIDEGKLMLFPCCPAAKISPGVSSNARAVEVLVGEKRPTPVEEMEKYWALPDFKLPELELRGSGGRGARRGGPSVAEG